MPLGEADEVSVGLFAVEHQTGLVVVSRKDSRQVVCLTREEAMALARWLNAKAAQASADEWAKAKREHDKAKGPKDCS